MPRGNRVYRARVSPVASICARPPESCNECLALRGGLAPWRAKRVVAYFEASIASNLRTTDLAAVVGLSTSHFFRAFKESFGETPLA
jgi:AraC family transcriptional regulator